jgi:hypothetical protein
MEEWIWHIRQLMNRIHYNLLIGKTGRLKLANKTLVKQKEGEVEAQAFRWVQTSISDIK